MRLPVPVGGKYGYIDETGCLCIPPQFDQAAAFTGPLALVSVQGLIACIDESGTQVISPRFLQANPFVDGVISGTIQEGNDWYIGDAKGDLKQGPFIWCSLPSEGLTRVKQNDSWLFYDAHFQLQLQIDQDWAGDLSSELIRVIKVGEFLETYFVNRRGERVLGSYNHDVEDFHDGVAIMKKADGTLALLFPDGKILPSDCAEIGEFSDGFASAFDGTAWGFIDKKANWAIAPAFDEVSEFNAGLAAVRRGESWTFVNSKGECPLPDYDKVQDFYQGFAFVLKGERCAYINAAGKEIWSEGA